MGVVNTTNTFTATDVITSTKMNNIIDQTVFTSDALVSGNNTLEVTGAGKLQVRASGITSNELSTGCVTSNAIADGAIVNDDINASAAIALTKLGTGALPTTITIATANITDFNVTTEKIADAGITAPKLSGAQTGSAPIYGCRAWVNFNGTLNADKIGSYSRSSGSTTATITISSHGLTTGQYVFLDFASGTVDGIYQVTVTDTNVFTITTAETTAQTGIAATLKLVTVTASGNVAYVGRASASAGRYIVAFSQDMPNANYALFGSAEDSADADLCDLLVGRPFNGTKTAKSVYVSVANSGNVGVDSPSVSVAFIG